MIGALSTVTAADPGVASNEYQVGLAPGTDPSAYVNKLGHVLGLRTE
jgi:hypothetical protein